MERRRVAIVGLGNVGRAALEAVRAADDLELAGVVRRRPAPLPGDGSVQVVGSIEELEAVDGAVVGAPTRLVGEVAQDLLARGISTVDSFDLHGEPMLAHRQRLGAAATGGGSVAVVGAGWDPGSDSVIRALFSAMVPEGAASTTFGPGLSMGHTVAARAIPGVDDALSFTHPAGDGVHRREVLVRLAPGSDPEQVRAAIRRDPYFASDETEVRFVDDLAPHRSLAHGVRIERRGRSAGVEGQRLRFEMRIENPALTAQMMVAGLRAAFRQAPGAYTLVELPPIDLLPGARSRWVHALV